MLVLMGLAISLTCRGHYGERREFLEFQKSHYILVHGFLRRESSMQALRFSPLRQQPKLLQPHLKHPTLASKPDGNTEHALEWPLLLLSAETTLLLQVSLMIWVVRSGKLGKEMQVLLGMVAASALLLPASR